MTKILLRIVSTLLVLHGAATVVAAKFLPLEAIGDRLLFAQHGFTFIFVALLNLVIWQPAVHGAFSRWAVHLGNLAFTLFNLALSLRKPEPPNILATVLVAMLFLIGVVLDYTSRELKSSPASVLRKQE